MKEQANKERKQAREYEIGEYAMLNIFDSTTGISDKIKPKFEGPFQVCKIL